MRSSLLGCLFVTGLVAWVSVGCGSSSEAPDAGDSGAADAAADAPVPSTCEDAVPALEIGAPDGHPDPLGAGPTEARAGRLTEALLPEDRTGLATWEVGDFILANDRVAMLIEGPGVSDLYDPWGGKPVGVFRVEGGRMVEAADFNEVIIAVGRHTVETESVTVLADGSDGGPAVVRAIGPLTPVPFVDDFARSLAPENYPDIDVAIDYTLAPGSDAVEVTYNFRNPTPSAAPVRTPLMLLFQQYRMPAFVPGVGFELSMSGDAPWVGFIDDQATSFALRSADGPLANFLEVSGVTIAIGHSYEIPRCAITPRPFGDMIIGGPGLDGLLSAVARTDGTTLREVTGVVSESDGSPATGVRIHAALASGEYVDRASTDGSGRYTLHVPPGALSLTAYRRGDGLIGPVAVAAGDAGAAIAMPPRGLIHVHATDAVSGGSLPARVQVFQAVGTPAEPPATFGEPTETPGRVHVEFPTDGDVTLPVSAGDYRVIVSRGYEYELVTDDVTVGEGATVEVAAPMERVVDTTGVLCGDFHIHTSRSPDSGDAGEYKVMSAVGRRPRDPGPHRSRVRERLRARDRAPRARGVDVRGRVDRAHDVRLGALQRVPARHRADHAQRRRVRLGGSPAAGGLRRRSRALDGAHHHHQPPARTRNQLLLRRGRVRRADGPRGAPRSLGRGVHARRGVQRLLVRPELGSDRGALVHGRRLVRPPRLGPPRLRGRLER